MAGHFLLTELLMPQLRASKPARIVVLSSRGAVSFACACCPLCYAGFTCVQQTAVRCSDCNWLAASSRDSLSIVLK
jgi:hypothetical protein